jgi:esterase/lipase
MKKVLRYFALLIVLIAIAYALGPRPNFEQVQADFTFKPIDLEHLAETVKTQDEAVMNLKSECETAIIWHNDSVQKTEYAIVFLHGFSACPFEGNPIVQDVAKRFGCNLYLHRFPQHGITDPQSFLTLTPKDWIESGKVALNIGLNLGEKVILMSSSTGGTVSAYLAAELPEFVAAQFLYSPNFAINSPAAPLINNPWGKQILRQVEGGDFHHITDMSAEAMPFWTTTYRIEGIIALQDLIEQTARPEFFEKITAPTFIGYYYKNEKEKDGIVSIDAMHDFYETIASEQKAIVPFAEVGGHVITNKFQKGGLEDVRKASFDFFEKYISTQRR